MITNPAERVLELMERIEYYVECKDFHSADMLMHRLSGLSHLMDADLLDYYHDLQDEIETGLYFE